ncbi:MAG: CotH kinase family protein [Lachnospiraceae bacterium]|nr:CotH kinase family protein [Lachnospiraceae bacterium]
MILLKVFLGAILAAIFIYGAGSAPVFARPVFDEESLCHIFSPRPVPVFSDGTEVNAFLSELEIQTLIPTVCVYTQDGAEVVSRDEYVQCLVYTINSDEDSRICGAPAGIRVRGNSTAYEGDVELIRNNQVPYRIKFDEKHSMFSLNEKAECKSWVLLKAEYDLLKNDIAFRFGRKVLRNGNFCSDGTLAHVYLNGKFAGIYELCEQHQVNKHRVNIHEVPAGYKGTDIGYFLELDNRFEQPYFVINYAGGADFTDINGTTKSLGSDCYTVKSDLYSPEQKDFIAKYVNNVYRIVYLACEKGEYYVFNDEYNLVKATPEQLNRTDDEGRKIPPAEIVADMAVDLDSFVDIFLVYELTMSRDVGEGSFFMCADFTDPAKKTKLTFTCPWDFEWAMESETEGSYAKVFNSDEFTEAYGERSNSWYILLMKQDWFMDKVCARWKELRTPGADGRACITDELINEEQRLLDRYSRDLKNSDPGAYAGASSLIRWVERRIRWMDGEYLR